MRSLTLLSIIVFTLVSCSDPEKPKVDDAPSQETLIAIDTIKNLPAVKDSTTLVLMGRGSEPGWICEFYANRVRFVYDYGKDSIIIKGMNFTYQIETPNGFESFKLESLRKDTIFETLPGPCTEETTGESRSMKMQITVGKKTYKGCAWVPK
ncbi:MAG: hypothetical protein KBG47_09820 [Bacteroidia bacterium]|jgi:uncharacterized membrane protein|nr:hypothetical protein [Sphingobacteriaceae bacterium]MBK7309286.1 hypothetical protein [Sphingobacteriaceae bacterium]MBP9069796.1 hypothetical protein [Bacteroidia bacterium]